MQTILGAGGAIGTELLNELVRTQQPVRLVGRNPREVPGVTEIVSADISDLAQTISAVAGSTVVHLLVGLKYDVKVWRELWPRIMSNAIEACKRARAKLLFFDNVYMYGKVVGPMTEATPFNPCSKKGEIRTRIATTLLNEVKMGNLTAMIARSADFYGPNAKTSVANLLVFERLAKGGNLPASSAIRSRTRIRTRQMPGRAWHCWWTPIRPGIRPGMCQPHQGPQTEGNSSNSWRKHLRWSRSIGF